MKISLKQLRGSNSLAQLADNVIAFERDQQANKVDDRNTTLIRSLKSRYSGYTGPCGALRFNKDTWLLEEVDDKRMEEQNAAVRAFDDADF